MSVMCTLCSKEFSKNSNLKRHMKEKHGSDGTEEPAYDFSCDLCDRKFKRKQHLQTHIDGVHCKEKPLKCDQCSYETARKGILKKHMMKHRPKEKKPLEELGVTSSRPYSCVQCQKHYKIEASLNFHMRHTHKVKTMQTNFKKSCPLCDFMTSHSKLKVVIGNILDHFKSKHDLQIDSESLQFDSVDDFQQWKNCMEKETFTTFKFVKRNKKYLRLVCHRSGFFVSKGRGKRCVKKSGSCKINGFCPASITVNIKECGKATVSFLRTHVGHNNDIIHTRLTKEDKKNIAASIASKIPYKEILKNIRRDVSEENLKRIHLTTRKDLINIAKSFKLSNESLSHPSDPDSFQVLVTQLQNNKEKGLMFLEPQGTCSSIEEENIISNETFEPSEINIEETPTVFEDSILNAVSKRSTFNSVNINDEKEKFILQLATTIRERVTNFEELDAVVRHCKSITSILDSLKSTPSTSTDIPTAVEDKMPANCKVIPQQKYSSTSNCRDRKCISLI